MLFLTKIKPNLHCMIFGHTWCEVMQEMGYAPDCVKCKQNVYDYYFEGDWLSLNLDCRIGMALWHVGEKINDIEFKIRLRFAPDSLIPF